jgi:hypothetical protein
MIRRKHSNSVPVAALVRWVVAAVFLCVAGLSYVYFKNEMQTTGDEIRNLEEQLSTLRKQDEVEQVQIARLSSTSYLQKKLAQGFIHLTPIQDDQIVRLHAPTATASTDATDDLQPVSNRYTAQ